MKKTIITIVFLCILSLSACAEVGTPETPLPETVHIPVPPVLSEEPEQESSEDIETEDQELNIISPEQMQRQVNICPDMPEPFIEVLKQYEQFMNADNQNLNDESVQAKIYGGEWKYLYDELCPHMSSDLDIDCKYALADLTGDGFPEMVIASGNHPYIIYNYSKTNGIGMEFASSYFDMTIYQNGIIEYVSGGAYSSTTYLQFQEDIGEWTVLDRIAVLGIWDSANQRMDDTEYYAGNWDSRGLLDKTITKEEYQQIQAKYVTEPMEFEWIPLV